jgi:hypothetical protein
MFVQDHRVDSETTYKIGGIFTIFGQQHMEARRFKFFLAVVAYPPLVVGKYNRAIHGVANSDTT